MKYEGFTTFTTDQGDGVLTVTFDFPPVNAKPQTPLKRGILKKQ